MRKPARVSPGAAAVVLCLLGPLAGLPTSGPTQPESSSERSLLETARRAAAEGRPRAAINILDRAISAGRRSSELFDLRGQYSLALGDEEAAEHDWRQAAQLDPANPAPRIALGRIFLQRGLWPESIRAYREVLLRDSRNVNAILGLSEALQRMGRAVGARRLIEAAGETLDDPRIQQRWAQVALESGRPDEAERALKQIAGNLDGPPKRDVIQRLAELYVSQGRYQEALAALGEAGILGAAGKVSQDAYDLLAAAADNLVQLRISALAETLQQLDAARISREESLEQAEATGRKLDEIDALMQQVAVPESRKLEHASRLYAYSLANEASSNALAYIDLGLAGKRDDFAARWRAAQAEMAPLSQEPSAGR